MLEALAYPLVVFVANPWLSLVPVALLAWLWFGRARGTAAGVPVAIALGLWVLYSMWEISFIFRPVREWIRSDLLAISPILLISSLWAVVAMVWR